MKIRTDFKQTRRSDSLLTVTISATDLNRTAVLVLALRMVLMSVLVLVLVLVLILPWDFASEIASDLALDLACLSLRACKKAMLAPKDSRILVVSGQ